MSAAVENAKQVLSELTALHEEGWCACQSSTLPARVESALGDLISVLSTPPADDVREALAAIVKQVSQKFAGPSLAEFANETPLRKHYATADAIVTAFEVRPRGTVTPTVDEWSVQMDAERARQVERGYDDAHDAQHGAAHLLNWAIDYGRRGNNVAAATLTRCAMGLLSYSASVSDAEVEAAAQAMFEDGTGLPGDYTWAQMVAEDPTRAGIWRVDARRALEAAREARS